MKYRMPKKSITFWFVRYLSACFLWMGLCIHLYAQTVTTPTPLSEKGKTVKVKFSETGITVKAEDIERVTSKEDEVKAHVGKSINEIKSFIVSLEQDVRAMILYRDRLRQGKKDYQGKQANQKYLELMGIEIKAVEEKIDIDNELIETYEDRITVLQDHQKVYSDQVVLLKSIFMLDDAVSVTPYDAAPVIWEDIDVVTSNIIEIQDGIKEKAAVVSFFTNRLKEIIDKAFVDEQNLAKSLKTAIEGSGNGEFTKKLQEKVESVLQWKKAVNEQRIAIFKTRLETSTIRYDTGLQVWKNAEINLSFLEEKLRRLEEKQKQKQKEEELKKKQAELEATKKPRK